MKDFNRMRPLQRSWRYQAVVSDYNKVCERLNVLSAHRQTLLAEYGHLRRQLMIWRKEKEETGRVASARIPQVELPRESQVITPETHAHIAERAVDRMRTRM